MRLAIDTNRYVDFCKGLANQQLLEQADPLYLPFVVLAELRAGFAMGARGVDNERILKRFLNKPGVELLRPDEATTRQYAALYRQLRQQGTPIPINDLWTAALAVQHDLALYTRDKHFRQLPQLDLVD